MKVSVPVNNDNVISARAVRKIGLKYISDQLPGYTRIKKGKGFSYLDTYGKPLQDEEEIFRIKRLVIPPAWKNVWIAPIPEGHLQATGIDIKGRKQYKYHASWSEFRNQTKYHRLLLFGDHLPRIRLAIEHDLSTHKLSERKVIALIISLMERTFIRIGSASYEKLYGSYGLTTLRDKHVKISGDSIFFEFKGKKGVYHQIKIRSRRLSQLVKKCRDIPGYELFQYLDEEGNHKPVDSGMVNSYLHEITGHEFTSKDFRTWAGTLNALKAFHYIGSFESKAEAKRNIVRAIDAVAQKLGNTRSVCKKYYVHPAVLKAYEEGCLNDYFKELDQIEEPDGKASLTCEEKLLMKLLKESRY